MLELASLLFRIRRRRQAPPPPTDIHVPEGTVIYVTGVVDDIIVGESCSKKKAVDIPVR